MDLGPIVIILLVCISGIVITKLKSIQQSRPTLFWAVVLLLCFSVFFIANEIHRRFISGFSGSYGFVEYWDFDVKESDLIEIIEDLKKEDYTLQPPVKPRHKLGRGSGFYDKDALMEEHYQELESDSTAKPPEHNERNSFGNSENGWKNYWYFIDFYYSDTKQIVHTWTRPIDERTTTFALISFSKINYSDEVKLINRDFWYLANKLEIKKFEKNIVNRIRQKLEQRNKSGI